MQVQVLQNIANGFEKCKFLKDQYGIPFRDELGQNNDISISFSSAPKKIHNDATLIDQIMQIGFNRN